MERLVSRNWQRLLRAELHLAGVFLGLVAIGWLMNGFNATNLACAGTVVMCCYLAWVGLDGVALVSVWIVGLMSMATINPLWLHDLPLPAYKYIPLLLLASWALALGVVWLLGKTSVVFRRLRRNWLAAYVALVCVALSGLRLGWLMYPESLFCLTAFFL
jgi:hypothetical protein